MTQYGLRTAEGKWLPRDAYKRGMLRQRLDTPDLWQDKERATVYASQYDCTVVEFTVATFTDRTGLVQPGHGKGEQ